LTSTIVGVLMSDACAEVAARSRQCLRSNLHAWWDLVEPPRPRVEPRRAAMAVTASPVKEKGSTRS
jgi:hypothetical protein